MFEGPKRTNKDILKKQNNETNQRKTVFFYGNEHVPQPNSNGLQDLEANLRYVVLMVCLQIYPFILSSDALVPSSFLLLLVRHLLLEAMHLLL